MKISTRGRYGLKAMVDLSVESSADCCVSVKSIAERQGISEYYLERLMAPLKEAGYIKSIRGAQGGYRLNHPPKDITVGDILRTLEGSLAPVECLLSPTSDFDESACGSGGCHTCVTKNVWSKMYDSLNSVVDSITLEDLVNDFHVANPSLKPE